MNDLTVPIYVSGDLYSDGSTTVDNLKKSKFTTAIVWALHVHDNGDLVFNDTPIVQNRKYVGDPGWPNIVVSLKEGVTPINRILFSIGGWECKDFNAIQKLIAEQGVEPGSILYDNFKVLLDTIPAIDGIDYDDETLYNVDTFVRFTLMLKAIGYKEVTFCPYSNHTVWVDALKQLESEIPGYVTGFNLQCYAGGGGNDPGQWIGYVEPVLGIEKARHFIFPGLSSRYDQGGDCPPTVNEKFRNWKDLGIIGGFIWNYDQIEQNKNSGLCGGPMDLNDYASAVINGLSEGTPKAAGAKDLGSHMERS